MSDLNLTEAVEAGHTAAQGVFPEGSNLADHPLVSGAIYAALTAAAPIIAAQAVANDPRNVAHIECDCVPNLGPSHCHLCSEREGREMPWSEAHPDLRARIEALRALVKQWRTVADDRSITGRLIGPTIRTLATELERAIGGGE